MPSQETVESSAKMRARFYDASEAFNVKLPEIPARSFDAERDLALSESAPTGEYICDISGELGLDTPATTPLLLCRYIRVRAGDRLKVNYRASVAICFVACGSGKVSGPTGIADFGENDVFVFPGGTDHTIDATGGDLVLWSVTNEPQLHFDGLNPPVGPDLQTELVHYPATQIEEELDKLYAQGGSGMGQAAVMLSSATQEHTKRIVPSLTLGMNSLAPHGELEAHKHNAAAVTLIVRGKSSYSLVDGQRFDWQKWSTMITPPTSIHAHINGGNERAMFLIVQDGGLYYHARTMGFEMVDY